MIDWGGDRSAWSSIIADEQSFDERQYNVRLERDRREGDMPGLLNLTPTPRLTPTDLDHAEKRQCRVWLYP